MDEEGVAVVPGTPFLVKRTDVDADVRGTEVTRRSSKSNKRQTVIKLVYFTKKYRDGLLPGVLITELEMELS